MHAPRRGLRGRSLTAHHAARDHDQPMNKRDFLKTSGVVAAGSMLSRMLKAELTLQAHRTNWAGIFEYSTDHLYLPANVEEAQANVKACSKIKALGARHSYNR